MLLLNRRDAVSEGLASKAEKLGWLGWKRGMLKRSLMDFVGGKMKNFLMRTFFRKSWGKYREMPEVAEKSFSKLWKEGKRL